MTRIKFSESQSKDILDALSKAGALKSCPRCGHSNFTLLHGLLGPVVQNELPTLSLTGSIVPTVAIYCSKCGFLSEHVLAPLGLKWQNLKAEVTNNAS